MTCTRVNLLVAHTFAVTNVGSTAFNIDGVGNPSLTLYRGFTYDFGVNAPGHPFWIKTAAGTGTGSAFATGVTNNGADSGTVVFTVPNEPALTTLYYNCQYHSAMTGTISITNPRMHTPCSAPITCAQPRRLR